MKNKLLYIIALSITLYALYGLIATENELYAVQEQNATLQQEIAILQNDVDKLTEEIERLQTKPIEAQKSNRSAERPRYNLTDSERDLVERVVMAESGGESYEGQMLVCQCILNACEIDGIRPAETVRKYVYAKSRPKPTESVDRAVMAVFDKGEQVTDEAIVYFYAPGMVKSEFHERQRFSVEEGGHRFFCAR